MSTVPSRSAHHRPLPRALAIATGIALLGAALSVPAAASAAPADATVTGIFVDAADQPLVGLEVYIAPGSVSGETVVTDETGRFTYTHALDVRRPIWGVSPDRGADDESIVARPVVGKTVSVGRVPLVAGAVAGDIIPLNTEAAPTYVSLINTAGKEIVRAKVNEDSLRYDFSYAKAGTYTVRFLSDQNWTYLGNTSNFAIATKLAVNPARRLERDITQIKKSGRLSGTLSPKSKAGYTAAISVTKIDGSELDTFRLLSGSGSFSFEGLPAGKYRLSVLDAATGKSQYFRGSKLSATTLVSKAKQISVSSGTAVGTFTIKSGLYEDSWE